MAEIQSLPEWKWGRMPVYNGFWHEERVKGWQCITWLIRTGQMSPPSRCSISGAPDHLHYHCENYYSPWIAFPISRPIHLALHRRFIHPEQWEAICQKYARTGDEWFARLSPTPIDLAEQLRLVHGDGIRDVFVRARQMG